MHLLETKLFRLYSAWQEANSNTYVMFCVVIDQSTRVWLFGFSWQRILNQHLLMWKCIKLERQFEDFVGWK